MKRSPLILLALIWSNFVWADCTKGVSYTSPAHFQFPMVHPDMMMVRDVILLPVSLHPNPPNRVKLVKEIQELGWVIKWSWEAYLSTNKDYLRKTTIGWIESVEGGWVTVRVGRDGRVQIRLNELRRMELVATDRD